MRRLLLLLSLSASFRCIALCVVVARSLRHGRELGRFLSGLLFPVRASPSKSTGTVLSRRVGGARISSLLSISNREKAFIGGRRKDQQFSLQFRCGFSSSSMSCFPCLRTRVKEDSSKVASISGECFFLHTYYCRVFKSVCAFANPFFLHIVCCTNMVSIWIQLASVEALY